MRIFLLLTFFATASGANDGRSCARRLLPRIEIDRAIYQAELKEMIARAEGTGWPEYAWEEYLEVYREYGNRLRDPLLAGYALSGLLKYARSAEDLEDAARALKQGYNAAEFFFTRVAVFARSLERWERSFNGRARNLATTDLEVFDSDSRRRSVLWNVEAREVQRHALQPEIFEFLENGGIRVSREPVAGLVFNGGTFYELGQLVKGEWVAARQISEQEPDQFFVGLGDVSVMQFQPPHMFQNGHLISVRRIADFLSVGWDQDGAPFFAVREFKFQDEEGRVRVRKALWQLEHTAQRLAQRYPTVPVRQIELAIPDHGVSLNDEFDRSEKPVVPGTPIYALWERKAGAVSIRLPQGDVPVRVRLLSKRSEME